MRIDKSPHATKRSQPIVQATGLPFELHSKKNLQMTEIECEGQENPFSTQEPIKNDTELKNEVVGSLSKFGQAALNYASMDWPVLPLRPGEKTPLTPNGFKDASTDETTIKHWWTKTPNANVGLLVGPESGLLVLDVDNKRGRDGNKSLRELRNKTGFETINTRVETTPSSGFHLYYVYPDELRDKPLKAELAEGLELKHNGYIVAAPSVLKDGGTYEDTNHAVADFPQNWIELCIKEESSQQQWDSIQRRSLNSSSESTCQKYGITMADVLKLPPDARATGEGYLIIHPIHGATGHGNLFVNTKRNLFCCYHHQTGGDPITWIAIREGFIDCSQAGKLDPETFRRCLEVLYSEGLISETVAAIPQENRHSVEELAQWLMRHPKHLIAYYRSVMDEYHQGEWMLKTTMWRQVHRIAYHSKTALLHSDMTGPSRGGKTSLMLRFMKLLPPDRKEVLTTVTPMAIWYKTLRSVEKLTPQVNRQTGEVKTDEHGNVLMRTTLDRESDSTFYVGKVIAILELSEMKDFGVLKALADEYEVGEFIHSTVIDHKSVELKIEGPRCVMTTSVSGIQNDAGKQLLNRFVQTPLDEPTENGTKAKLEMVADRDLDERSIETDPRTPVLKRALELLYADGYNVSTIPPSNDVRGLIKAIDTQLYNDGFNITQIRGFHTFALNAAFEKRFARGDPGTIQIQEEDVLEAWHILTTFGNFARGNLTRAEHKLLNAIPGDPKDALDASDLREITGLGVATINDALRVKDDPVKGQGKFLQYGYVNYIQGDRASLFYRQLDGNQAVSIITKKIEVDGTFFEPLNPCPYPYTNLLDELPDSLNSAEFVRSSESQKAEDEA